MGRPDSVFSEPLLRNPSVNCLLSNKDKQNYKDHLCLFRALARYMNGHKDLGSLIQILHRVLSKHGYYFKNVRGVCVEDLSPVEEMIGCNLFTYDFDVQ